MIQEGSLKRQFHVVEGIEKCPEALPLLFSGGNIGKLCVPVIRCAVKALYSNLALQGGEGGRRKGSGQAVDFAAKAVEGHISGVRLCTWFAR